MASFHEDLGAWVAIIVGLLTIFGAIIAVAHWMRRQLRDAIYEDISQPLSHLHKCVERLGGEAASNAKEAQTAAKNAQNAVVEQTAIMRDHFDRFEDHVKEDQRSFDEARRWREIVDIWRAGVDIALRNIQQGQAPHDESPR